MDNGIADDGRVDTVEFKAPGEWPRKASFWSISYDGRNMHVRGLVHNGVSPVEPSCGGFTVFLR